ncbi:MAG: hypothetical protein OER91_05035 [Gammaproteobacteria bacterium]|nr:hypothetical protein [Gammaproteobacteria bacterium]
MSDDKSRKAPAPGSILKKEAMLFVGLLFIGLVILPVAIWFVGHAVFGAYDGMGYMAFFGMLSGKIRAGDPAAWFLVLSPWLVLQCIRLMALGWRAAAKT